MADDATPDEPATEVPPLKYPDVFRPSETTWKHYLEACQQGLNKTSAAEACGVSPSLAYRWLANWPELKAEAERARKKGRDNLLKNVEKASKKHWQAAKWLLETLHPEEFGKADHYTLVDLQNFAKAIVDRLQAKLADIPQAPELIREAIGEAMETLE